MANKVKKCGRCGHIKFVKYFYVNKRSPDGYRGYCIGCSQLVPAALNPSEVATGSYEYARAKLTLSCRLKGRRYAKYCLNNINAILARKETAIAIREGLLVRPNICSECKQTSTRAIHAHHTDYNKPLEVTWLCVQCHVNWHKHNAPLNRK